MKQSLLALVAALVLTATAASAEPFNSFSIHSGDVTSVKISLSKQSSPSLEVVLTADKARELAEFTRNNLNQKVVFQINGEAVSEPFVRAPISGDQMTIELDDEETAIRLAKSLLKD